ncbi:MAG: ERAP1-like C-terminal domain-containing protein [Deltaproteobacteria bacterium]|jgi:aminopeptidase N|nr:ERAP1-like C-terminal domain-containing protein [Deltaproteobacteria bacterium]
MHRFRTVAASVVWVVAVGACGAGADPNLPPPPSVHPSFKADIPPPLPSGRLPETAQPRRSAVDLEIDPAADRFRGDVYIDVLLPRATSAVVLHGSGLEIARAEIIAATGRIRAETSFREAAGALGVAEELVLLPLQEVPAGEAVLHIEYSGRLSPDLRGVYRVEEGGERFVFTQFEPADARRMMPCFDEPSFKIPYSLRVTVPKGNLALSNGRERGRLESEDGERTTFVFATTPPLPSYLLAVAVGPFEVRDGPPSSVPVRLVTTRGKTRYGAAALEAADELLRILGEYFDRVYPYDKLDLVAVPNFAPGGMENAGLVTFREELLLVDPEAGSARARRAVASLLAHELAHQWFGNLVTMRWWDDLWLNEGLATLVEAWAVDRFKPAMHADLDLLAAIGDVMERDALESVRAVRQPVANAYQAEDAFDGITYLKGAAVLGMLRHWLGEEPFQTGLRSFLRDHEWGNAAADDLLRALSTASGQDVGQVASAFLDRQGVPVVRAELQCEAGKVPRALLSQARYRVQRSRAASPSSPWAIPVCVEYGVSRGRDPQQACTILTAAKGQVELPARRCPAWFNPNASYRGYYRYTLPAADLEALSRATRGQDARSQIGFLSNLWSLVAAGEVGAEQLFGTLPRFKASRHRRVLEQVIALLERVSDTLVDDRSREPYARFVASLLLPSARKLGWDARPGESDDDKLRRRALLRALARMTDDPWLSQGARRRAQSFLQSPASVDPDTAAIALAVAAREPGSAVTVEGLLAALERAESPQARLSIATALGSFREPEQARQAFELIVGTKLRAQDALAIVREASRSAPTRRLFVAWLEKNLVRVADRYPGFTAARMLSVVGRLCDRVRVDRAGKVFGSLIAQLGRGERRLRESLERAEQCVLLRQRQGTAARTYLERGRW